MKSFLAAIAALVLASISPAKGVAQWTVQNSGIPTGDQVVLAAVNQNVCWGVTRDPGGLYVTRSTNGGATWVGSNLSTLNDLWSIAALGADTAWIGATGAIYRTTDGGDNWTSQLTTSSSMFTVRFFDSNNGVCVGDGTNGNAEIYTTTNGGAVWTPVSSSNIPLLQSEGFIPSNSWVVSRTIWVPTNGGSLFKSSDRGLTWNVTRAVVSVGGSYCAFKDTLNGLLSGSLAGIVKRTTDGGSTWTPTDSKPEGISTLFMSYIPGTSGSYMVTAAPPHGPSPGSAITRDDGATWTGVDRVQHGRAAFVSPSVGWSWGGANVIYKWTGQWTPQASGTRNSLFQVRAVSQTVAWAVGLSGTVLRTTNEGETWTSASGSAFGSDYISGIEAVSRDTAFIPYNPGRGTTTHIYRTTNGGAIWNSVYIQSPGYINVIRMIDAANGIAVGDPSGGKWTVLTTSDGGSTWARILTEPAEIGGETGSNFNGMSVVGASHIWFTSRAGRVYRSTDGGATWNYSAIPFSGFLPRIHFNDMQYGLVGDPTGTTVLRSTDGGISWSEVTLPNSDNVGGITGSGVDFYVNKGQQILHSSNRGETYSVSYSGGTRGVLRGNGSFVYGSTTRVWAVTDSGEILRVDLLSTGVKENRREMPGAFKLEQNYPNPFNPLTVISYQLSAFSGVRLTVHDLLGREVAVLVNERKAPGSYEVKFDGTVLASGVYFYRLQAADFVQTRKLLLLK